MQYNRAGEIKTNWGDKPCNHPNIEKEYYLGAQTGDVMCSQCGKGFCSKEQWEKERNTNKDKI